MTITAAPEVATLRKEEVESDLLRLTTAGSVDDGKSTLIGRLLYDTKSIFEDQLEAIERASRQRGDAEVNLALLTDGLRAEREQNITIDVAYRYFATPKRKFIIADTPGHVQYTRNMVTGASTAELAIVLVDARRGVQTQSKRHGFIASLLGIPHVLVAVNKMDLVDHREDVFEAIVAEYRAFAESVGIPDIAFIPISALHGDNVVDKSERMPWYGGATLLHHLETVNVRPHRSPAEFRFPVQYVVRPNQDFRGFAGRIASGTVRPGDEIVALPGGLGSRVASIVTADGELEEATAGESVVLTLEDEIDVSRGDLIARAGAPPAVENRFVASLCWLAERPLDPSVPYVLMQTTRQAQAFVSRIHHRIDVDTLEKQEAVSLGLNEIGRVEVTTSQPLAFDPYDLNPVTGSFVLIDPHTNVTAGAGMIREALADVPRTPRSTERGTTTVSPNVVWEEWNIDRQQRESAQGHAAAVVWFTGLSGSGKTTVARGVERRLFELGCRTMLLEGDQLRHGICGDLGFSEADRRENLRRAGEVARLFFEAGSIVLCTFVSPYRSDRDRIRASLPEGRFLEIHMDADLETCIARDPKGLYSRALAGEIRDFTGVDAPYENPENPELRFDSAALGVDEIVERLLERLRSEGIVPRGGSHGDGPGAAGEGAER